MISEDDPIPLAQACKLFFNGALTKSALRTEHRRGNLDIIRIANKDFVTKRGLDQMIERCKLPISPPTSKAVAPPTQGITAQEAVRIKLHQLNKKRN